MEPHHEDRREPEVEIDSEPSEYSPPLGYQRPSPQSSSKKWVLGIVLLIVLVLLSISLWMVLPSGIFLINKQTETPEQKALKAEVQKLRSEADPLKNEVQSLRDGQKAIQDQLKDLLGQLKNIKDQQTLLEKKTEASNGKKPAEKPIVYKVKKGDSLRSVAQKFQVRTEDIRRWNRISGKGLPAPGQKITIHQASSQ
jgi:LysM repeat protein